MVAFSSYGPAQFFMSFYLAKHGYGFKIHRTFPSASFTPFYMKLFIGVSVFSPLNPLFQQQGNTSSPLCPVPF
jgi:hypothetical protein